MRGTTLFEFAPHRLLHKTAIPLRLLGLCVLGSIAGSCTQDIPVLAADIEARSDVETRAELECNWRRGDEGLDRLCELWEEGTLSADELVDYCLLIYEGELEPQVDPDVYCLLSFEGRKFEEFDAAVMMLREENPGPECTGDRVAVLIGTCNDGEVLFIHDRGHLGGSTMYYDAGSGAFLAIESGTDFATAPCCNRYSWPSQFDCADPMVSEVVCKLVP